MIQVRRTHGITHGKTRLLAPLTDQHYTPFNLHLLSPKTADIFVAVGFDCPHLLRTSQRCDILTCYLVADMSANLILKSIPGKFNGKLTEQNIHINEYWKHVQEAVGDRTVCIILDEIDKMLIPNRKNDFSPLCKLSRAFNACVGVTNNRLFLNS